ncbi:MAG TPA: hypothetical protein GX507_09610 [Clostridia bacterium]|nr:hypothetical protein [Clostridia bacterium]
MLTRRREEFLQQVIELYRIDRRPVHYTAVAERLGVSKWTAYDILCALADSGYLEVEHDADRKVGQPGRSMVLFKPTDRAFGATAQLVPTGVRDDWLSIKEHLLSKVKEAKKRGVKPVIVETLSELGNIKSPLLFCAYMIIVFVLVILALEHGAEGSIAGYLLFMVTGPQLVLVLLAGAALALVLRSNQPQTIALKNFESYVPIYEENVRRMDKGQQQALLDLAKSAVRVFSE